MFPPMPTWDSLHPLIIHFPIALLMVAPLFVLAGLVCKDCGKWIHLAALALMVMGTLGAFVAVSTGEAAAELALRTPAVEAALEHHEEMAETTQVVFAILTSIYALLVIVPWAMRKPLPARVLIPAHGAFVLLFGGSLVLLVNTAHQGGLLVHEYGVHAMLRTESTQPINAATIHYEHHGDDD